MPVKVVSERLSHSSPASTMSVYQHVLPGMQADAARAFSDAGVRGAKCQVQRCRQPIAGSRPAINYALGRVNNRSGACSVSGTGRLNILASERLPTP